MASANPTFRDGASNKPPLFSGEYFNFWKIHMKAHLEAQGDGIWKAVVEGPFVPMSVVNGVGTPKIESSWDEDDKKKYSMTKRPSIYFIVRLAWMNFSVFQHVKRKRKYGIHWWKLMKEPLKLKDQN